MRRTVARGDIGIDLEIAAILREAGAGVDDAAFYANRLRVAATTLRARTLRRATLAVFVARCGISEPQQPAVVDRILKVARGGRGGGR